MNLIDLSLLGPPLLAGALVLSTHVPLGRQVLVLWFKGNAAASPTLFYVLFALSVTTSVQLVGVYLVFASLIIPALATRGHRGLKAAYGVGLAGYLLGSVGSLLTDLPTGPSVVWSMAIVGVIFGLYFGASQPHPNSPGAR